MPSPVGHALGGLIVALALASPRSPDDDDAHGRREPHDGNTRVKNFAGLCVIASCLPDIDFMWGRHNMETHSIGFALLVGLAVLVWKRSTRLAAACALAVGTHVLFDWLGSDDSPPLGVMALWPFGSGFYFADAYVFEAISRRYWLSGFVMHNVLAVMREVAILMPVLAAAYFLRRARGRSTQLTL